MDADTLIVLAARGDADAQSALVDMALSLPKLGICHREEAACSAELFARMAATHGRQNDRMRLAGVLLIRAETTENMGQMDRRQVYMGEAVQLLSGLVHDGNRDAAVILAVALNNLADEGDERAGEMLATLEAATGADVIRDASDFDRKMKIELAAEAATLH